MRIALLLVAVSGLISVTRASQQVPCLPNDVIPAGEATCRTADGRELVGPPPARRFGDRTIPPPPVAIDEANKRDAEPVKPNTPVDPPLNPPRSTEVWWTIGGVTAIAALLAAVAGLIKAFR